jgi:hypothetical protein
LVIRGGSSALNFTVMFAVCSMIPPSCYSRPRMDRPSRISAASFMATASRYAKPLILPPLPRTVRGSRAFPRMVSLHRQAYPRPPAMFPLHQTEGEEPASQNRRHGVQGDRGPFRPGHPPRPPRRRGLSGSPAPA